MEYKTFGRHVIADLWGIDFERINDIDFLKLHMEKAAQKIGATILSIEAKKFIPYGATILVLLSESHLSIHTYPEKGFAAIDGYTCGEKINPVEAIDYLIAILEPKHIHNAQIIRGTGELIITTDQIKD